MKSETVHNVGFSAFVHRVYRVTESDVQSITSGYCIFMFVSLFLIPIYVVQFRLLGSKHVFMVINLWLLLEVTFFSLSNSIPLTQMLSGFHFICS